MPCFRSHTVPAPRFAAEKIGCDPLVLVIALMARAASRRNRAARRLAQAILANRRTDEIESRLARHLRGVAPALP